MSKKSNKINQGKVSQSERKFNGNFSKVESYIDKYALSMNQVVGLNALMEIYFDTDCDCLPSELRKCRSILKIRLLNYYRDQIMILKTTSNSSAVVISSASAKNKVTMTENYEELITKAAVFIRSDIEECYKEVSMTPLN